MPLTAGGKLTIVASSDLGALGAKDGLPMEYNWILPSLAPLLLPWLAILGGLGLLLEWILYGRGTTIGLPASKTASRWTDKIPWRKAS